MWDNCGFAKISRTDPRPVGLEHQLRLPLFSIPVFFISLPASRRRIASGEIRLYRRGVKILHLFISPDHNYTGHFGKPAGENPIVEVDEIECVAGSGIQGDRFFDYKPDYKGQITFFAMETHLRLCGKFGVTDKGPDIYRRNIIVEGTDLNALIGKEFSVQGVKFLGTEEAKPCFWMDQAFAKGAEKALRGSGGLRAKILTDGTLSRKI